MFGLFNPSLGAGLTPGASGMGMQMPQQQNPGLMAPQGALSQSPQGQPFNPQMMQQLMGLMQMGQPQMAQGAAPMMQQGAHPYMQHQQMAINPAQLLSYMRLGNG